jgi:hypothetical protein
MAKYKSKGNKRYVNWLSDMCQLRLSEGLGCDDCVVYGTKACNGKHKGSKPFPMIDTKFDKQMHALRCGEVRLENSRRQPE